MQRPVGADPASRARALAEALPHPRSTQLFDLFRSLAAQPFLFVQPGGNAGDHLIYRGAEKLAALAGVRFRSVSAEKLTPAELEPGLVVYVHGGGGFVPWWSGRSVRALDTALREHEGIVVLGPTTFHLDAAYLDTVLGEPIAHMRAAMLHLFVRERVSFDAVERFGGARVQVYLDHDTALNLQRDDLLSLSGSRSGSSGYALYAIRDDRESPTETFQPNPLGVWLDPARACRTFESWLDVHVRAGRIVTNRTHSTIAGAIAGVPTTMLTNSYHKNRGIWEFSLRDMDVAWCEAAATGRGSRAMLALPLVGKLLRRGRVRRAIHRLHGCTY